MSKDRLKKSGVDKIDYHIPERYTREELIVTLDNVSTKELVDDSL